jgi:N-methylhydantoinase B
MEKVERSSNKIDPMTLSIVNSAFVNIADQMAEVIQKTATSFILCEILDFCSALLDRKGRIIVQSERGLPLHVASSELQLKCALDVFGDEFYPGDIILQNDPYTAAGNHLPDWTMIRPIFVEDELTFFALCKGHQMDTKGAYPGGYFPGGYDIHSEGLIIPPTKIYLKGEKQNVYDFILHNVRWPESVKIDNMAMIAALKIAEQRIRELCTKYGKSTILSIADTLMEESEKAVRNEIKQIPDGNYEGESAVDRDGSGNEDVHVRVTLRVRGDELIVDFSRSDKQVTFVNSPIGCTYSSTYMAILPIFDSDIIKNHGALKPIKIIAPKGSVVNPEFPATIGACGCFTATTIIEAIQMALGKVVPEKVSAPWCPSFTMVTFGDDPRTGETYWMVTFQNDGGGGAIEGYDGCHHISPVVCGGNILKCPVELAEIKWPWQILKYELLTDSGGAGKFRGGLGIYWEAVNKGGKAFGETGAMSGEKLAPFGLNGGKPGILSKIYIKRKGKEEPAHTMSLFPIQPGDVLVTVSSGGGGVGDPYQRPIEKVKEDVLNGYVSIKKAREDYGVVLDSETLEINEEATKKLREGRKGK